MNLEIEKKTLELGNFYCTKHPNSCTPRLRSCIDRATLFHSCVFLLLIHSVALGEVALGDTSAEGKRAVAVYDVVNGLDAVTAFTS